MNIEDYLIEHGFNPQDYDMWQLGQLQWGLEDGFDISIYINPKYNAEQMLEIRRGLEFGLEASIYADPIYDWQQMQEFRNSLALFGDDKVSIEIEEVSGELYGNVYVNTNRRLYAVTVESDDLKECIKTDPNIPGDVRGQLKYMCKKFIQNWKNYVEKLKGEHL